MATEVTSRRKGNAVASRTKKSLKVKARLQFKKTTKAGTVVKIVGLSPAANTRVARAMDKAILDELSSPAASKRVVRAIEEAMAAELARQARLEMLMAPWSIHVKVEPHPLVEVNIEYGGSNPDAGSPDAGTK